MNTPCILCFCCKFYINFYKMLLFLKGRMKKCSIFDLFYLKNYILKLK